MCLWGYWGCRAAVVITNAEQSCGEHRALPHTLWEGQRQRCFVPGVTFSVQADWTRLAPLSALKDVGSCLCTTVLWAPALGRAMYTGDMAACGGCVYVLEAQRKEPRGVFISTAKAEKENVRNSGPNLHKKLRKCHHYSLMYNIAWGCNHGNLHILRKTSDYLNMARRKTPDKIEMEWKNSITQTPPTHMNLITCCPHWGEPSFMCRRCAVPWMSTQAI